jgi:alanyl-tRNA synthetase
MTVKNQEQNKTNIAIRVIVDHVRAALLLTDNSNTGAGYVIRRILRRAIRWIYF